MSGQRQEEPQPLVSNPSCQVHLGALKPSLPGFRRGVRVPSQLHLLPPWTCAERQAIRASSGLSTIVIWLRAGAATERLKTPGDYWDGAMIVGPHPPHFRVGGMVMNGPFPASLCAVHSVVRPACRAERRPLAGLRPPLVGTVM